MASSARRRRGGGLASENWERLVRAALGRTTNIEQILQAADDIKDEDPNVARILCEQAYSMAQNLDPIFDGRGVLQFKTGLASVIKQKLAKKEGGSIDCQNDIEVLWDFYLEYKKRRRVDDMQREQEIMRESEMGARALEMKKIYATLRALLDVLEILVGQAPSDSLGEQILEEIKKIKRSDAALRGELMPYNIIPLDTSSVGNVVGFFPEVAGAVQEVSQQERKRMGSTLSHIPLQQLKYITNNFFHELGRGSFGVVYKGMLENGHLVAVKKLVHTMPSSQEQFENEVNLLMDLKHPNIVRLLGYCYEMQHSHMPHQGKFVFAWNVESLLCLEYLTNGSLDKYISDASSGLDWPTRCKIIQGISDGLQYLHEQSNDPIIHLDLKPANILLDENMVPKIADFGLSRLFDQKQTIYTALSSGTLGYMPPEYLRGIITPMSDIFSLGVIIMEVITGHREYPYEYDNRTSSENFIELELQKWRIVLQKEPGYTSLEADCEQIKRFLQIGLICVNPDRTKRPAMRKIIDMLQGLEKYELVH